MCVSESLCCDVIVSKCEMIKTAPRLTSMPEVASSKESSFIRCELYNSSNSIICHDHHHNVAAHKSESLAKKKKKRKKPPTTTTTINASMSRCHNWAPTSALSTSCCPIVLKLLSSARLFLLLLLLVLSLSNKKCMCLNQQQHNHYKAEALMVSPHLEPSTSIFSSLLGNNAGNSAAQQDLQQAQQTAADLHQSYKNGQTSDKVSLPGDILLGGLFPIHMKGMSK